MPDIDWPRPHTMLVKTPSPGKGTDLVVTEILQSAGTEVQGQLDPRAPAYIFERWGAVCQDPAEFMVYPSDRSYFHLNGLCDGAEGDEVDLTGSSYKIAAKPKVFEYGADADCALILLEKL